MDVSVREIDEQPMLGMHGVVAVQDLPEFFGRAFTAVAAALEGQGLEPAGPPVAVYDAAVGATATVTAGFPTTVPADAPEGLVAEVLPGGRVAELVHCGRYDAMETTYAALMAWFAQHGVHGGPVMWEQYLVGPDASPDPCDWRTRVVWPVVGALVSG
ncbi:GyrI-like domain-containing protein [Isoptericola sp. b441]|uniref:GyrI-like domain-containing protein n=1 Tax=Actinotalea lenta TaxID=3064654 RepID=A0ABT9D6B7_9CELL|nr:MULTISPECIES: GyrI-like domain-containing protein [unclassified Isoptericola]MDO8106380.1 GyrI-like domain-containing protein [Isoptericola sp. b441]MDO8121901.1 GyrI-like domain-containing protein [Isoptericola sp. b490]